MIEALITLLIWICVVAIVIYLVIWVLQSVVGISLPGQVIKILWVIFALICILFLARLLLPMIEGGGKFLGSLPISILTG